MAAYKLEDNIREKLEGREIKPSADSWKKLEANLNTNQPKKKTIGWYYLAASFIGILILSSVFFNRGDIIEETQIVDKNVEHQSIKNPADIITKNSEKTDVVSNRVDSEKNDLKTQKSENPLKPIQQNKGEVEKKFERNKLIAETSIDPQAPNSEAENSKNDETLFNQKVDEVVASVKRLQETNSDVSVMEVEQLLQNARQEIHTQRILKSPKVDATALLQDVELDLEKSFRDKVFDALGEGFRKIRTAVIERND